MKNIAVFASGNGSNFKAIYYKINDGVINGKINLLVSNNPRAGAVDFAYKNDINVKIVNDVRYPNENKKNNEYKNILNLHKTDLILLAGFMKKIPRNIIKKFNNKIMNVHPSLLPKYGGKGFYGINVHKAVIDSNDHFSGATVHFVNEEYDKGPIIIQKKVKLEVDEDYNSLSEKVLKIEHTIYPYAVRKFCEENIIINKNKVYISE